MPLIIPHVLHPGMAAHDCFVRALIKDLQSSKLFSPQTEAARLEFIEKPARDAYAAAVEAGEPEAYAKSAAEQARLMAKEALYGLVCADRRSVAKLLFYATKEQADSPGATPIHTASFVFDYDMRSDKHALRQVYEAAKIATYENGELRFPGARDA